MRKISRAIRAALTLRSPRTWGPFVETAEQTAFDHAFTVSWAQGGEDIALVLELGAIRSGRYLDIGAHHPSRFSVTRKLHQLGWSGVNVDANRDSIAAFVGGRPSDVNIWSAVGDEPQYEFTVFVESAISTVSKDWEQRFVDEGQPVLRRETVPGVSLRALLDAHFASTGPDLLSIDIEGADEIALRSGRFESLPHGRWPSWLLLETSPPVAAALASPAVAYAASLGYEATLVLPMATLMRLPNETQAAA